ncbi:unnamed protein product [Polarella glacialis]|uniref:Uncharacterized protein n=1 Tax=Polarella glacialis TaxID=89957 RepID=A0A813GMN7_POLGL|nr:unnamed protein product [Polarella glacialis]CAE8723190.1 unnamed protein product [Polarella glacialis]
MADAIHRLTVDSPAALAKVASKAPNAVFVIPELADEDSPEGWQVMGMSRVRVTATVTSFLEHALYDLTNGIPEEYRGLPAVVEQREQLQSLIEARAGALPFTVELRDVPPPGDEDGSSLESKRFNDSSDGQGSILFFDEGPTCRPIDEQLGLALGAADAPEPALGVVELGSARDLRRCVIAPGNGCTSIKDSNWYGWLHQQLVKQGIFEEVVCRNFPDPYDAKRSVWIPFLQEDLKVGPDTVLVGHSSGCEAAMRLAEETPVGGLVLVAACHSDLGDEGERASGYYPPSGGPWNWEAIRKNTGWIVQFHSRDDHLIPVEEGRAVAKALGSEYHELDGHSHFFEPFNELVEVLRAKTQK